MFNTLTSTGNWKTDLDNLRKFKAEIDQTRQEMPSSTPYFERKLREAKENLAGRIMQGAIEEQNNAIQGYKKALKAMGAARVKEANRFDIPKLQQEFTAIQGMIERIKGSSGLLNGKGKREQLEDLYNELMGSTSIERQRACLELFEELPTMGLTGYDSHGVEMRHSVVDLAVKAHEAIPPLRVTPEMVQADTTLREAKEALVMAHEQIADVGYALGEGGFSPRSSIYRPGDAEDVGIGAVGPLGQAWRTVRYQKTGANRDVLEVQEGGQ